MMDPASTRTVFLQLEAPFAAFRWLQAGVYRGTFPVMPPSAAWGLALNLAGIEARTSLGNVTTSVRPDAPHLEIAVGIVRPATRSTLYQQLHAYPVGDSGRELQARAHGQKYWIAPAKREVLVDLVCIIGVRGAATIIERIALGLAGDLDSARYGLPFAGDNQFLFNRIDIVEAGDGARWYTPVGAGLTPGESTRLTTVIDRHDASRTTAPLFAPTPAPCHCPAEAWIDIGPASGSR